MSAPATRALIFKVNQLGDNVVFLPAVQRLVADRIFPKLALWTTPLAAPLYRNLPLNLELDSRSEFYPAWKNPLTLMKLAHRARKLRPEVALVAEDMGNTAYFLALVSGASSRIGTRPHYLKIPFAITQALSLDATLPEAVKSWRLGSALAESAGQAPWQDPPPVPDISHLIHNEGVPAFDIFIHAGASVESKRWPLPRFLELAERLARNFRVGWCASPGVPATPKAPVEIVHTRNLDDLVSHLAKASLFIGNNSGPMNLASALGTPSLIFVGPSARSWDPYWHADRIRILRDESLPCIGCAPPGAPASRDICTNTASPMACMKYWTVDCVEKEAREWFKKWAFTARHSART